MISKGHEMDPNIEHHLIALGYFKDWSNFLLVTTVAALGWVATKDRLRISVGATRVTIACFGASIVFGMLTLAMIPIVAEQLNSETESFYKTAASFKLFWLWGPEVSAKLKLTCWPQHTLFVGGIAVFTCASVWPCKPR